MPFPSACTELPTPQPGRLAHLQVKALASVVLREKRVKSPRFCVVFMRNWKEIHSDRIQFIRMRAVISILTVFFFNSDTFQTLQTLRKVAIKESLESKTLTEPSQRLKHHRIFLGGGRRGGRASEKKCPGIFRCCCPLRP